MKILFILISIISFNCLAIDYSAKKTFIKNMYDFVKDTMIHGPIYNVTNNDDGGIGSMLKDLGYTSCSEIPASGSKSLSRSDGYYTLVFATPQSTVASFEKRIKLSQNEIQIVDFEFSCSSPRGYINFGMSNGVESLYFGAYYDTANPDASKFELIASVNDNMYLVKFQTEPNGLYKFWITSIEGLANQQDIISANLGKAVRIAVHGDSVNKIANAYIFEQNYDANPLDTTTNVPTPVCVDLVSGTDSSDCGSLGLTAAGESIFSGGSDFSVDWVNDNHAHDILPAF